MATITEGELLQSFNDEQALVYLNNRGTPQLNGKMEDVLNIKQHRLFVAYMEQNINATENVDEETEEDNEEPEKVTVEIEFNSPMKGVSETSPEMQAICKELEAEIVIDQGTDLTLVLVTAPTEKACFDAQLKFWNVIAKHQKDIECNYEAHLIEAWSSLTEEDQLDFQNETNVRVSKLADEDGCLLLSAFKPEHLATALTKLRESGGEPAASFDDTASLMSADYNSYQDSNLTLNGEPIEERQDGVCYTKKGEIHLKIMIQSNVVGLLIGKQGATINWLKDHFGVTASVHGDDNKTVVYLVGPDMDSMILTQKDIWKTLSRKQKIKDTFYDDAVCDAWEQISEKEQLELQNQTNVNVKLIKNGLDRYLFLRAFTQEQLEDAKVMLYKYVVERPEWFVPENEEEDESDDQSYEAEANGEATTPVATDVIEFPPKPTTEDKGTDTSDLDITEWLRDSLRSLEEMLHGSTTVSNVADVLKELPSILCTINDLKKKLEQFTPKSSESEEILSSTRGSAVSDRLKLFERIRSPIE